MYKSLQEIMEVFLKQDCGINDAAPCVAVLALAGIVISNQCRFTNLDWIVDGSKLEQALKIGRVELINDFVAQGYGMLTLGDDEVIKLNDAVPKPGAPKACIGAGTGLGQCFLCQDATGEYTAYPSEGSHGEFAPRGAGNDDLQIELLKYLKIKFSGWSRISMERIVSGTGICNIYEFLAYTNPTLVDLKVHKAHLERPKEAGVIAEAAFGENQNVLCMRTMKIFASCYGACCGNVALMVQPFGGLYITGGVTKRLATWLLEEGSFMRAYLDKGRVSPLLEHVPLLVVKSDDMGQRGAHLRAVALLKHHLTKQARLIFDELDTDKDGSLSLEELQKACRQWGDEALGEHLMELLDSKKDGVVCFDEFCAGFSMLPGTLAAESNLVGAHFFDKIRRMEPQEKLSKTELVPPADRGYGGEDSITEHSIRLAALLDGHRARNRRYEIDPYLDKHQPVFKAKLWKLHQDKSREQDESWLEREFWITKEGDILYFSVTTGITLMYCTRDDLRRGSITLVNEKGSKRPFAFKVQPVHPDGTKVAATEFAATTEAGRKFWIQMLEEARAAKK
mmetsp:Transcript_51553/g.136210  ORF Transcript_51553/g.136210 Transcript_51553/m.136210 type:complete len:565 (+) Transcript_51553:3-1697(+)